MQALTEERMRQAEDEAFAEYCDDLQARISNDILAHSQLMRAQKQKDVDDDDWDDDDGDVEVIYVRE